MTAELYRGSFVEPILEGLTTALGIECRIGALEEARTGSPPRVTFVPPEKSGISTEPSPFSELQRETFDLQAATFDVDIWAESATQLYDLHYKIDAQLENLIGPKGGMVAIPEFSQTARPGYDFGKPASVGPVEDNKGRAGSVACLVPVVLKRFVSRKEYGTAPIVSVPIEVDTADDTAGTNAEQEIVIA